VITGLSMETPNTDYVMHDSISFSIQFIKITDLGNEAAMAHLNSSIVNDKVFSKT
jgi:hypothetical protein